MSQRVVYMATAAIVAAMVGGFALAQMSIGQTNVSYQGSQTTTVEAVPGLTYVSTTLVELNVALTSSVCTSGSPCSVSTADVTDCAGGFIGSTGCAASDYVEQVLFHTEASTQFIGTVTLTIYVSGSPVGGSFATVAGASFYYTQADPSNSVHSIVIDFDVGTESSGPGAVATVTVIGSD